MASDDDVTRIGHAPAQQWAGSAPEQVSRRRPVWPYVTALAVVLVAVSAALVVVLVNRPGGSKPPAALARPVTSSAATAAPAGPAKLGQTQTEVDSLATIRVTVYAYRVLPSQFPPDRKGFEFGGADTRLCVVKTDGNRNAGISWGPWSLGFADDTTIDPVSSWSAEWFSVPLYPATAKMVRPGHCIRGWILFEVPKGKRPTRIAYSPDSAANPTEWAI